MHINKSRVSAGWHAQTARGTCTHLPLPCKRTLVRFALLEERKAPGKCCGTNLRPLPLLHSKLHRFPHGLPETPLLTGLPVVMRRLCLPVSHLANLVLVRQTVAMKGLQPPLVRVPRAQVPVPLTPKHLLQCGCAQKSGSRRRALRQRAHATKARKKQRSRQRLNMFRWKAGYKGRTPYRRPR